MILSQDVKITCEAIIESNIEAIIDGCNPECRDYCQKFTEAYLVAKNAQEIDKSNAFYFLSLVCSMTLCSSDERFPFQPYAIFVENRTVIPSDFTSEQCKILSEICSQIVNPELAARLADIAWIGGKDFEAAKLAIKKYIETIDSAYCKNSWSARIKRLERAMRISVQIGDTSTQINITKILLKHTELDDELFDLRGICSVLKILMDLKCLSNFDIAERALFHANQIIDSHNTLPALDYANSLYQLADKAFRKNSDHTRAEEMKLNIAKVCERKAAISASAIAAAAYIRDALVVLKNSKNQKQYIERLQRKQIDLNQASFGEMTNFQTSIDLSPLLKIISDAMKDQNLFDSFFLFAKTIPLVSLTKLKEVVLELQKNNPMTATVGKPYINQRGRTVAIIPPFHGSHGEAYELALYAACCEQANFEYQSYARAMIIPALEIFKNDHMIDYESLSMMLSHAEFIPPTRINLWVKGLLAGFNGDFDIALHILIPQFEVGLRQLVETHGEVVWNTDKNGVDSEKLLRELLGLPKSIELLGEDTCFNLKCLLIERVGFNVRNDMCHGLMEEMEFFSMHAIYAWWLLLRIVINSINQSMWNDRSNTQESIIA